MKATKKILTVVALIVAATMLYLWGHSDGRARH
jgi:hypothetical protein